MRFQSFDCPLSAIIEYPLPAKFCYIDFMKILHAEVRESEEAAEIARKLGWEAHNDQIEPGSFRGMCVAAWMTEAQFHRRQFTRKVCVHGSAPNGMVMFGVPGPYSNGARFGGHWITSDAICLLPHGEESMVHLPANQLFTMFGIMWESLGRAWQAMAQTSFRLRTGCAASANGIHAAIAPRAGGSLCGVAIARQRFDRTRAGDSLHGPHRRRPAPA